MEDIQRDEIARELLLAAAHQAMTAAEALLRAAKEAEPVDDETLEKLADAARILIDVEFDTTIGPNEEVGQLQASLVRFLNGWAG